MEEQLLSKMKEQKNNLIGYMRMKIESEDWHAVADAAMDLREIEARIEIFLLLEKK